MSERLRLLDLVARVLEQESEERPDVQEESRLREAREVAVQVALDVLRCGVVPTVMDLARDRDEREAWIEASKRLEHERAQRLVLALAAPGVDPDDEDAVSELRLTAYEARVDAWLRSRTAP